MPSYRRAFIPGGTYFFTVKTERNAPVFGEQAAVRLLGTIIRAAKQRWPFDIAAMVLLPDHLHAIWSLPPGDDRYSTRWAWIKKEFTKQYLAAGGQEQATSISRRNNRRRGVWQRRFWEHTIEEEQDYQAHFDYVHWNPVKHHYVTCPVDWPHSSFHRWVRAGVYPKNWGCGEREPTSVVRVKEAGELVGTPMGGPHSGPYMADGPPTRLPRAMLDTTCGGLGLIGRFLIGISTDQIGWAAGRIGESC